MRLGSLCISPHHTDGASTSPSDWLAVETSGALLSCSARVSCGVGPTTGQAARVWCSNQTNGTSTGWGMPQSDIGPSMTAQIHQQRGSWCTNAHSDKNVTCLLPKVRAESAHEVFARVSGAGAKALRAREGSNCLSLWLFMTVSLGFFTFDSCYFGYLESNASRLYSCSFVLKKK